MATTSPTTTKLFFIRHGEKPKEGGKRMNGLSKKGERRREEMGGLLEKAVGVKEFEAVFSVEPAKKIPKNEKHPKKARPSLTVECVTPPATLYPRGKKLEDVKGDRQVWFQLLEQLEVFQRILGLLESGTKGNYLICWEHHIEAAFLDLLWKKYCGEGKDFHPKGYLKWPKNDFDTIIIFDGNKKEFSRAFQNFEETSKPEEMTGHDWNLPLYTP